MPKVDKEKTIQAVLAKQSPFCMVDEDFLRKRVSSRGGIGFLRSAAKVVRAEVVYLSRAKFKQE